MIWQVCLSQSLTPTLGAHTWGLSAWVGRLRLWDTQFFTLSKPDGLFVYRHIQPAHYRGFQIAEADGVPYAQATLAKAFFDYLYLRPLNPSTNLAEELRLNIDKFTPQECDLSIAGKDQSYRKARPGRRPATHVRVT